MDNISENRRNNMELQEFLTYGAVAVVAGGLGTAVGVVGTGIAHAAYKTYQKFKGVNTNNMVAIIPIDGMISNSGGASPIPFKNKSMEYPMPLRVKNMIKTAMDNRKIKGIVFEINSPGGEVQPSEEIANYIRDCVKRETKESEKKRRTDPSIEPVYETVPKVGLIKHLGASGGYLIAGECDYLFGGETSTIGSIGVMMGRVDVSEGIERHGIKMHIIRSGKLKGLGHPGLPWSQEEEDHYKEECKKVEDWFVKRVVTGRENLDEETVRRLATGQSYNGLDSLENGLIDEITTHREDAIKKLEELGDFHHDGVKDFRVDFSKFPRLPLPFPIGQARLEDLAYMAGQGVSDSLVAKIEESMYAAPKARF